MSSTNDRLAAERHAVEAARERLAGRLGNVEEEVRGQVASTGQTIAWKVAAAGAAFVAAAVTRKVVAAVWTKGRGTAPPDDPARPDTAWVDALGWTAATAVGVAVAQVVARRGAAAGWQKALGAPPPGLEPGR